MNRGVLRLIIAVLLMAAAGGLYSYCKARRDEAFNSHPPNGIHQTPAFAGQTRAPIVHSNVAFDVASVASDLEFPWGMAFLPDGRMLVTEKPGRLRVISPDGTKSRPVTGLPEVYARNQGGLLDVALDPDFSTNHRIYWSYSEGTPAGLTNTAVARGRFVDGASPSVADATTIYRQTPQIKSSAHYGGRLVFGRDGTLFITQGERGVTEGRMQAQRMDGLLGKIVRVNPDGSIPQDNPFVGRDGARPEIWSIGHRNVQAAALNPATGELWETEHGTQGGDELNVVRKGKDYGWPTIAYGIEYNGAPITGGIQRKDGMEQPVYYWDPVIAPSGMMFYSGDAFPAWKGNVFIGGLASRALVRLEMSGDKVTGEERLLIGQARVRDVVEGPGGAIYLLTDAADGKLLRLSPRK